MSGPSSRQSDFPPTRWTLVLSAQNDDPEALASLCKTYWYPLYAFARRSGHRGEDAQDLTQGFFERILSTAFLNHARQERGKLRTLLLRSFKNYAADQWAHARRKKRGGGVAPLPIDAMEAEARLQIEPVDPVTPELEFDRSWAREIMSVARRRLQAAYRETGKEDEFRAFEHQLSGDDDARPYRVVAEELGLSEAAARYTAFKLRQRYRDTLGEVVTETVTTPEEAAEELTYLKEVFTS